MTTLCELMESVEEADYMDRMPSVQMIRESGWEVAASADLGENAEASVFVNGFVLYRSGRHLTVFRLHDCLDYTYKDAEGREHVTDVAEFLDQPWQVRIMMEGEDRVVHNNTTSRRIAREISYDANACVLEMVSDKGTGDPLHILLEREEKEEKSRQLHIALSRLTRKQQYVVMECILNGRQQADIAKEMGTTRMNVTNIMRRAMKKLRDYYGLSGMTFCQNRFYRAGK